MSFFDRFRPKEPPKPALSPFQMRQKMRDHQENLTETVLRELREAQIGPDGFVPDPNQLPKPRGNLESRVRESLGLPPNVKTGDEAPKSREHGEKWAIFPPKPASDEDFAILRALEQFDEDPAPLS